MKSIAAFCLTASLLLAGPLLAEDTQPPAVTAIAIAPNPVDVTSGSQTATVTLTITDDDSGFRNGYVYLYRPNVSSRTFIESFPIDDPPITGDTKNGTYEVTVNIPSHAATATWEVDAYVYDDKYNSKNYGTGNGATPFPVPADATFSVLNTGPVDTAGPTISNLIFDPLSVSTNAGPATITASFDAADSESGVSYGYFQLYNPDFDYMDDLSVYIGPDLRLSGDEFDGSYEVTATLPPGSAPGTWTLYLYVRDKLGNYSFSDAQELTVTGTAGSLSNALDAAQFSWTTSDPGWKSQSLVTHDGVDAAKSESAGDDETRTFETTVTGPGTLSFHWKVDSEEDADYLSVEIPDTADYEEISGNVDWQEVTLSIPPGEHAVVWSYSKNSSDSMGEDCGWVDEVRFLADSESAPPVLQSVVIAPNPVDVSNGDQTVTVTLEASDDFNGISEGTVYIIDPSGSQYDSYTFTSSDVTGDSNYGTYEINFDLYGSSDSGIWRIEVELIEDSTNNTVYYGSDDLDFPNPGEEFFTVTHGSGGGEAPVVVELSASTTTVNVADQSQTIEFTLRITDEDSGFAYGNISLRGPSGQSFYKDFNNSNPISGDDQDGVYQVSITVSRYAEPGPWTLVVSLTDQNDNTRNYPDDPNYALPDLDSITVVNLGDVDSSDPRITSFVVSTNSVNASAAPVPIAVDIAITDNLSGLEVGQLFLYDPTGKFDSSASMDASTRTSGDELNGTYQVVLTIPMGAAEGIWTIRTYLKDKAANSVNHGFSYGGSPPLPGPSSGNITVGTAPVSIYQGFVNLYSLSGNDALPNADPDHDGVANAAELMLGTNPKSGASGANLITVSQSGGFLHLDFTVAAGLTVTADGDFLELGDGGGGAPLRMTGQTQSGLGGNWTNITPTLQSGTTYRVSMPITPGENGFARLFFE